MPAERVNDDRLYRALDRLLPHKEALEAHLKRRLGVLFALDYELLLYDVTSTYFEGQAERNPLARRGYSRDHRPDCKQVCIGLVVTREGMPLGYEVFAGNRTDVTTVAEIVGMMERRYGRAQRVWVMDRGMTSAENIAWLQSTERPYLIGASKSELKKLAPQLAEARDWRPVRDGVEAKVCAGPEGREIFLLVRSSERQQKEQAMHARFCARIETGLASLHARLAGARKPVDRSTTERQIGRLLGRNARAAARYDIRLVADPALPAGLRLDWSVRAEWDDWSRHSEGCYVLRTNLRDWPPDALWRTYCGGPLSSSPRRKRRFASTRATSQSVPSGISARSRPGPSPGLLPGLRALENARAVAEPGRSRQLSAYHPPGTHGHPERRCRPADRGGAAARVALALRRTARSRPGHPARTARTTLARTVAHACRCTANVVPTRRPKPLKILV